MTSLPRLHHRGLVLCAIVATVAAVAINLFAAHRVSVVLPMVDGWAVWDRVLRFNAGAMSWREYLFTPHGAHLHFIVYLIAWFDYFLFGADQTLMRFCSLSAIAVFAFAASWLVWQWGALNRRPQWLRALACVSTAALLTSVIDTETLIQPFQVVLSMSRLFYFALLGAVVVSLVYRKPVLYAASIAVSMLAVAFHGSGYIFAGLVIVAHLLLARRLAALVVALFPLAAVFWLQRVFSQGSGELGQVGSALVPSAAPALLKGASAYFATPFRALVGVLGNSGLLVLGFFLMASTAALTIAALVQLLRQTRGLALLRRTDPAQVGQSLPRTTFTAFFFLTGLFLLLSASAASVFWIVRTAGPGNSPGYLGVLVSPRYTAYATVAVVMILGFSTACRQAWIAAGAAVLAALALPIAFWPAAHVDRVHVYDDMLNSAAAALSIGISPLRPEADAVWPQADADWYWSTALPKTVARLRLEQKSIWKTLPPPGAIVDGPLWTLPLALMHTRQIDGLPGKCTIEGTLSTTRSWPSASTLVALVSGDRQVIGFAVRMRQKFGPQGRRLSGFLLCDSQQAVREMFVAEVPTPWHQEPMREELHQSAENLSDATWLNGVALAWSGFFVRQSMQARQTYVPGTILRMPDGQLKVVTRTELRGDYLNIFLDGGLIDGNVNGYPHPIEVVR